MKKMIIAALVLSSLSAFAGTTANLTLKGSVAAVNELTIAADASAQSLNITDGNTNLKVATLTEKSNDKNGYDIFMSSLNAGKLQHVEDTSQSTTYQISYAGSAMTSPTAIPTAIKTVSSLTGLTTVTSDVQVNVTPYTTAVAGDYTDTVTFTLQAK